jgi:CheY-like chemotaxis protein
VVENDPDMRRGYEMILRDRLGMVPRIAGGTAEALATMGDEPPDVILADYHLENGDTGVAAIESLRAASDRPVPAVMVTAHRDPQIARTCTAMGVNLLEKPVRPGDLAEILGRLLA